MGSAGWVVVLEGQPSGGEGPIEASQLRRLLEHMPGVEPIALHSAERVAVQVHVDAPGAVEALRLALVDLRAGLPRVGLWDLKVVRAEVLTWEEFEKDCRMADGKSESSASSAQEVTDGVVARRAGDDILRRAFLDPLTGLGFVNERWGRSVGDGALVASADRLGAALRAGATAGRIADDEFAVLFGGLSAAQVEAIASRLVEALSQPVLIGDVEATLSPGVGIARSRPDQDAGDLVAQARAAAEQPLSLERQHQGQQVRIRASKDRGP